MKNKLVFATICIAFVFNYSFAQWQQSEFMIGIYGVPGFQYDISNIPADYDGDGKADIATKINSGSKIGQWRIDNKQNEFSKKEWDYISPQGIYGDKNSKAFSADFDGDGKADICVITNGIWQIDFASDGFGIFDWTGNKYVVTDADPVPADYDGDGKADISEKAHDGRWLIDYALNGFGSWDWIGSQYGGAKDIPYSADFDGDGKADICVVTSNGIWLIDSTSNGFGSWDGPGNQYDITDADPVPADYDGDGKADICEKAHDGRWLIDYASNGFGSWEDTYNGYGGSNDKPYAADFDGDGKADICVVTSNGIWLIDTTSNNLGRWDWSSDIEKNDGDYNINEIYNPDLISFNKIKSCYIDLLINPNVTEYLSTYKQKDYYLALLDKTDLKVFLRDNMMHGFTDPDNIDIVLKNEFVNHFKNGIPDYLKDNIYGIHLGDEPWIDEFSNVQKWTNFFKQEYNDKPIFYNLNPRYGDPSPDNSLYETYLDNYIVNNNSDIVSFDHYPFIVDDFRESYFYNLHIIKKKAKNKPVWATVNTREWFGYPVDPNEQQLKFMAFCPIAYGVKGIMYWTYLDGFDTNETKYSWIKKINCYLKNIVAPVIMSTKNTATLHKANTNLNVSFPFGTEELIKNNNGIVKDVNKDDILIGIFDNNDKLTCNTKFIWVVNKNISTVLNDIKISLAGNYLNNIWISPRVDDYNSQNNNYIEVQNAYFNYENNQTILTIPELTSGEGIMIKLNLSKKTVLNDFDGDGIADINFKSDDGKWSIDFSNNGFGNIDWVGQGYGGINALPVSADYDGDSKTDISVKFDNESWMIDYALNGFGSWDWTGNYYGGANAHPAPADYDGDGKADICVIVNDIWLIDYASNGFGSWDWTGNQYGITNAYPAPADYDGDGKADISMKCDDGRWLIDSASNGFGSWDWIGSQYGGANDKPYVADYDGDGKADLCVKVNDKKWLIDYASNGFGSWDIFICFIPLEDASKVVYYGTLSNGTLNIINYYTGFTEEDKLIAASENTYSWQCGNQLRQGTIINNILFFDHSMFYNEFSGADNLFAASGNTVYWQYANQLRCGAITNGNLAIDQSFSFNGFSSTDRLFAASGNTVYWQCGNQLRRGAITNGNLVIDQSFSFNGFSSTDRLFAASGNTVYWQSGNQIRRGSVSIGSITIDPSFVYNEFPLTDYLFSASGNNIYWQSGTSMLKNAKNKETEPQTDFNLGAFLSQNVPNPFKQATEIDYYLPESVQSAIIKIYNTNGVLVKSIPLNSKGKGRITIYSNDLPCGVFIYKLLIDGKAINSKRMIIN